MDWFARPLLGWWRKHGRKNLPWQSDKSAYRVWVSEIMLQQTQVATVVPYFERFMARFPTVQHLACATEDEVLQSWTGLGYYSRARNLRSAAAKIVVEHGGEVPDALLELTKLPGIGRSTAGAISAIAFKRRAPILDGNVRRVLSRFHAENGLTGERETEAALWRRAETHTPHAEVDVYTQAIMDLGATICRRRDPACDACPLARKCRARASGDTLAYPSPRKRRPIPTRRARLFVVVDDDGACLLEKRPPRGVWASLWSPPQREPDEDVESFVASLHIAEAMIAKCHFAPPFRHTFTHYHLDIEPVYVFLEGPHPRVAEAETVRWHRATEPADFGLSAVATRLLASIDNQVLS